MKRHIYRPLSSPQKAELIFSLNLAENYAEQEKVIRILADQFENFNARDKYVNNTSSSLWAKATYLANIGKVKLYRHPDLIKSAVIEPSEAMIKRAANSSSSMLEEIFEELGIEEDVPAILSVAAIKAIHNAIFVQRGK